MNDVTVVVSELFNQAEEILNVKLREEKAYVTAVSIPFPISTVLLHDQLFATISGCALWDDRTGFFSAILETRQILWCAYGLSQWQGLGVEGIVNESREGAGVVVNVEVNWVCSGTQVLGVEEGVVWVIGEDVWLNSGWREDDEGEVSFL